MHILEMTIIGRNVLSAEFEKLYFENYTKLCQKIYRFVRDEDVAKDIVQDVFLNYWQKFHELKIRESPEVYLYRSCINRALNYLKESERRAEREQNYADANAENYNQRPDLDMIASETKNKMEKAIDNLPAACKIAFLLSRHEQKSYKEIATLMEISVNIVEKHIGKALKILRKVI